MRRETVDGQPEKFAEAICGLAVLARRLLKWNVRAFKTGPIDEPTDDAIPLGKFVEHVDDLPVHKAIVGGVRRDFGVTDHAHNTVKPLRPQPVPCANISGCKYTRQYL